MFRKLIVLLIVLVGVVAFAQQSPKPKPVASETCVEGKSTAWGEGFTAANHLYSTIVGSSGKFHVHILVENIDGADAYRFAVAEVIRQHFAENIVVEPNANLTFYIGAADYKNANDQVQALNFSIVTYTPNQLVVGSTRRNMPGEFMAERDGTLLVNYPVEQRTQEVREKAYSMLSKFLADWQKAGTK